MYQKTKDGTYYNPKYGRIVVHKGYSTRIFWSASMLDYLRRWYRCNPGKASVKAMKAWETRRARKVSQKDDSKELVL